WFFVVLSFHRRKRSEFEKLVETVLENIKASRFHSQPGVMEMSETMVRTMADEVREEGLKVGLVEGRQEGMVEDARSALWSILMVRFGDIPLNSKAKVVNADLESLRIWRVRALKADSLD